MVADTQPHALARQLREIADILERDYSDDRAAMFDGLSDLEAITAVEGANRSDNLNKLAQSIYAGRRLRDKAFGADLFGEAAWDILLDLYIAEGQSRRVSLKSAAIGSAAPLTTAHRWLTILEERGLIVRYRDLADARRIYIRPTQTALDKMTLILRKRTDVHR